MLKFQVNKLVRNKILDLMKNEGREIEMKVLRGKELQRELLMKIKEETDEALAVLDDDQKLIGEIADIKEALEAFIDERDFSYSRVQAVQKSKRDSNGGLDEGYFVETIALDSEDEWVKYYHDRPLQYQEIFEPSDESDEQFNVPYIETDLYQHFKGKYYEVIGVGCHVDTLEYYVIYRSLYRLGTAPAIWLRPYKNFIDRVEDNGQMVPRFRRIGQ